MKIPVLVQIQCLENCKIKLDGVQRENHRLNYTDLQNNFELSQKNLKLAQN